jgi:type II secretory pathway component PulJ
LAEVLVASTISAFVALIAVGALKAVTDSSQIVNRTSERSAEVGFAARMLARDLANLYRDADPRGMRLIGASQGSEYSETPYLRFYTVGRAPARIGQPEGDVYEVEYVMMQTPGLEASGDGASGDEASDATMLFRRLWPNPDREREPGGILVPIAKNIDVFQIRFFDGEQWVIDWPEELESLPQLIEVTLATLPRGEGEPIAETFVMSFNRMPGGSGAMPSGQGPSGQGPSGQPNSGNSGNPGQPSPGGPPGSR